MHLEKIKWSNNLSKNHTQKKPLIYSSSSIRSNILNLKARDTSKPQTSINWTLDQPFYFTTISHYTCNRTHNTTMTDNIKHTTIHTGRIHDWSLRKRNHHDLIFSIHNSKDSHSLLSSVAMPCDSQRPHDGCCCRKHNLNRLGCARIGIGMAAASWDWNNTQEAWHCHTWLAPHTGSAAIRRMWLL